MSPEIKIGIVGLGRAGRIHERSISNLPELLLYCVVDPDLTEDQIQELRSADIKHFNQLDLALQEDPLQAVIVSSPTAHHFDHITLSLEAGMHVFTEKPMGKSLQDIRLCYELAQKNERCLYLGFQRRYDENFRALKENIPKIAPIRMLKASSRDNPQPSIDYLKISGNIFQDMLIHDFDMMINLLGPEPPLSVFASGHAHDPEIAAIQDQDMVLVGFKYPNGLICTVDTSRSAVYGYDQRLEVFGANGMLRVENQRDNSLHLDNAKIKIHLKFQTL